MAVRVGRIQQPNAGVEGRVDNCDGAGVVAIGHGRQPHAAKANRGWLVDHRSKQIRVTLLFKQATADALHHLAAQRSGAQDIGMKVLVAGATGVLGKEIVRRLRRDGHAVTALVRSTSAPENVANLRELGASTQQGDLKDPQSLTAACSGMDAVISTVSMVLTAQPGDSFAATDGAGTINLIDAAAGAHAERFVFVSFDTTAVPDCPLTAAKRAAEDHLKRSDLTYSILHPSLFMESWLGPMLFADPNAGTAKIYGDGRAKLRFVAVANVAELAVQCLTAPSARNATIPFGGPDEISQRDAVRMFEDAYGKPFAVTEVPEQALEAAWRSAEDPLQKSFSALMLGVARGLDSGMRPAFDQFPMSMVSVADFVQTGAAATTKRT